MKILCCVNSHCTVLTNLYEHVYIALLRMYCLYDLPVYIVCVTFVLMIANLFLQVSVKNFHLIFAALFILIFCRLRLHGPNIVNVSNIRQHETAISISRQ